MNGCTKPLILFFLLTLGVGPVVAQDVCKDLFAQGYYDEHQTFSDRQSFKYVQGTICSDTTLTRQQADDKSLGSGGSYYEVIKGFLNLDDQKKSFEEQRRIFCSMNLDTATDSASLVRTSRVVSQAATAVMKACFNAQGFHAAIVPSRNPESFAIRMTYNPGEVGGVTDILVNNISANPSITCDTKNNTTVHSGKNILCSKPAAKTVQVAVNTDKGSLPATDVLGTADLNNDIQNQIRALTDKLAVLQLASCIGCIEQSVLTEDQFRNVNGPHWVPCDGRNIGSSKLALQTGISNVPDLRGVFLRGKNFGKRPGVEETELGVFSTDTVGPHQHKLRVSQGGAPAPSGISWGGGSRLTTDELQPMYPVEPGGSSETRPKNVTVNFFCKID